MSGRASPNNTGQFRFRLDFPNSFKSRAKTHSATPTLTDGIASGIERRYPISGGFDTPLVEKVKFHNDTEAIHKILQEKNSADAEYLVSLVGLAIGAPVPRVIKTDEREIYMELMPGRPAVTVLPDASDEAAKPYARTRDGLLLALLDAIAANNDRHTGNWLIDSGGSIAGIDHGDVDLGTGVPDTDEFILPGKGVAESIFARYWLVEERCDSVHWKDNPLHSEDVRALLDAVMSLHDEIAGRGYNGWWHAMMGRLEAIHHHARGRSPCLAAMTTSSETPPQAARTSYSRRSAARSKQSSPSRRKAR